MLLQIVADEEVERRTRRSDADILALDRLGFCGVEIGIVGSRQHKAGIADVRIKRLWKLVFLILNWYKHAQLHVLEDDICVHAFDLRIFRYDICRDLVIVADV